MGNSGRQETDDAVRLLYRLQVYQLELEQQNESLRDARDIAAAERDHYGELLESCPAGYLVIDLRGTIMRANSAAADLVGAAALLLIGRRLVDFVAPPDVQRFRDFLAALMLPSRCQCRNLRFDSRDGSYRVAHLAGRLSAYGDELLIAAFDTGEEAAAPN